MTRYVIRGGVEGKKRLELLARVMWPTTARVFERAGLAPGMICLDLGCGVGDVAVRLAALVGAKGRVVGLDMDETNVQAARQNAARRGLDNVQFRRAAVQDWREESQYDFICCRFLLTHLREPVRLLEQIRRGVRPGGIVVVEDIDFSGYFCHPPCAGFDFYVRFYRAVVAREGADADIGLKLYRMMLDAGWPHVDVDVVQPTFSSGEGKQLSVMTLVNIGDSLLAEKLVTESELQAAIDDLNQLTEDSTSLISSPRIFQVWARLEDRCDSNAAVRSR